MDDATRLMADQLSRMRGMTGLYHRLFFSDVTRTTLLVLALFVAGWTVAEEAFLLIPVVALIGAVQTAFDSSYLVFARTYARALEGELNRQVGRRVLVAAEMEHSFLFPLDSKKIVTIPLAGPQSWFSFVTAFYTVVGAAAYIFGLVLGWDTLSTAPTAMTVGYLASLIGVTVAALAVGWWWFVGGVGERRLADVLDDAFGPLEGDAHA